MSELPFDPADPPARPPSSCLDELVWNLAYRLFRDHRPDQDGFCITCVPSEFSPCIGRYLAARGFLVSCGLPDPVSIREVL
ncbi:hypothetical protein GCM10025331_26330 [Actinoplanes utahensis]|nr:hypothetical protein Aut01nite_38120 [Actinoplanes utahensis]